MGLYGDPIVRGTMNAVWWSGAVEVQMLGYIMSVWGLVLMITESWINMSAEQSGHDVQARLLHSHHHKRPPPVNPVNPVTKYGFMDVGPITLDFILARAVVDFNLELAQFLGLVKIGRGWDYWRENVPDLIKVSLPLVLFYEQYTLIYICAIVVYWSRLCDAMFSEYIQAEILPITLSANALGPACAVAFIAFSAFSHVFYVIEDREAHPGASYWPDTFFQTFGTLITASMPANVYEIPTLLLAMYYSAILSFSVFFLNIFIGVICEAYADAKGKSAANFQNSRANCCLTFLLQARFIPCSLMSRPVAWFMVFLSMICMLSMQIVGLTSKEEEDRNRLYQLVIFILLFHLMFLGSFQIPNCRFVGGKKEPHFIWVAWPTPAEDPSQDDRIEGLMGDRVANIESMVEELKTAVAELTGDATK
jgi:hypothetical protein